jgi:hypothetical protein
MVPTLEKDGTVASITYFLNPLERGLYRVRAPLTRQVFRRTVDQIVHFLLSVYSIPDVEISVKFCIFYTISYF